MLRIKPFKIKHGLQEPKVLDKTWANNLSLLI